jgi:hypothetical protein
MNDRTGEITRPEVRARFIFLTWQPSNKYPLVIRNTALALAHALELVLLEVLLYYWAPSVQLLLYKMQLATPLVHCTSTVRTASGR